jgi:hypothetical protein
LAFRNDDLELITFSWRTSQKFEESQAIFNKLTQAALIYIVPEIVEKVKCQLEGGEQIRVGNCTMESRGVVFQTQGWFTSKTRVVPWSQVGTDLKNGILTVFDKMNPTIKTAMPLQESENALVLQFLARSDD